IQRAGRCARRKNEHGDVYVFQPLDDDNQPNYAPYLDDGLEDVCERTWAELVSAEFNGKAMRFPEEQRLVERAHGDADRKFVEALPGLIEQRVREITKCMASRDSGYVSNLIRAQSNASLFISYTPNNDDVFTTRPWQREALSLSKGQIGRAFQAADDSNVDLEFLIQYAVEHNDEETGALGRRSTFEWRSAQTTQDIWSPHNWQFVAHPQAVFYDKRVGLVLRPGDQPSAVSPEVTAKPWERLVYHAERYHEHITGLYWAYTRPIQDGKHFRTALRDEFLYPLQQICHRYKLDADLGEQVMRLLFALHDVGKLNGPWQRWARAWQQHRLSQGYRVLIDVDDPAPLAHTDIDTREQVERDLQRNFRHAPRGPHAVESAQAVLDLLEDITNGDEVWMAVSVAAIARHHTPSATDCAGFEMVAQGPHALEEALHVCGFKDNAATWAGSVAPTFRRSSRQLRKLIQIAEPDPRAYQALGNTLTPINLIYLLFVRILRLGDQRSGRYWRHYTDPR
ncbi:MAG: hypothetical protein GYB68_19125, partial [Chloroflexi bacterium]|nr:hypothetical protein [Chloroflexota bacterium]